MSTNLNAFGIKARLLFSIDCGNVLILCNVLKQVLLHIAFFISASQLIAQSDTVSLREANIEKVFDRKDGFTNRVVIDSLKKASFTFKHAGDVIQAHTGAFIKSYGVGQIASISLRGTGASHTSVFWEGLNLQSASLGQVDFSMVPIWFFNELEVNKGPDVTAKAGAASAGGNVHLNAYAISNFVQAGMHIGSFGSYYPYGLVSISKNKWKHKIGLSYTTSANDFEILETKTKQEHAQVEQKMLIGNHWYQVNDKNVIKTAYWLGENDREIPATIGKRNSEAELFGKDARVSLSWKRYGNQWQSNLATGVVSNDLAYLDPETNINSNTKAQTLQQNWECYGKIGKSFEWNSVWQNQVFKVVSTGYQKRKIQNRTFVGFSIHYKRKKHSVTAGIGSNLLPEMAVIPLPSGQYTWQLNKKTNLFIKSSRVFRLPSFNDLYWYPSGNPNLKPEDGWSHELGISQSVKTSQNQVQWSVSAFSGKVTNWIIWLPNGATSTPENRMLVNNKGVEASGEWSKKIKHVEWLINANTNFIVSENALSKFENDKSLGKQLIYVPYQTGFAQAMLKRKKQHLQVSWNYTGARYTTADNSSFLPAISLINAGVGIQLVKNNKHFIQTEFSVNNVLNKSYQVVAGRSMPGVNYQLNFIYTIKTKKNETQLL